MDDVPLGLALAFYAIVFIVAAIVGGFLFHIGWNLWDAI